MNDEPLALGDGLTLRWAAPEDADELAAFNVRIHSDDAANPETFLGDWTHDLMRGEHPTTKASDFTLVVDENAGGKIVSTMNLISQTWAYAGIPFKTGRPELVATAENYRRRGLVKAQFEWIHAKSAARGELVQAITGISWYYRQFGYEMCVNLHGGRPLFWIRPGNDKPLAEEKFQIRTAVAADIPLLTQLYEINCQGSLLTRLRDEAQWRFECFQAHRESPYAHNIYLIETNEGEVLAYAAYSQWQQAMTVTEIAVLPGHSLREVALFLIRHLKTKADELNETREKPVNRLNFDCGVGHPIYVALDRELEDKQRPYAWYMRVPDLPAFLRHIAPALEARLANSVMAGYSGQSKLSFFKSHLALHWQQGKLKAVEPYTAAQFYEGHAYFPDLTFLQLLFGYRSLAELNYAFADQFTSDGDTAVLLNAIFPKQDSWVVPLG